MHSRRRRMDSPSLLSRESTTLSFSNPQKGHFMGQIASTSPGLSNLDSSKTEVETIGSPPPHSAKTARVDDPGHGLSGIGFNHLPEALPLLLAHSIVYCGEVRLSGYRILGLISIFLLITALWSQDKGKADPLDVQAARGSVVGKVTTLDNPAQSYALYLPPQYSPDRRWPIIYAFDPFARGKTAVEVYQAAAAKYGYIVAGSNNSQNGPVTPQMEAAQALWNDTHRRLAIDKDRVYTTGLSGGARVATSFALYCYTCAVTGVIAHGAGYPVGTTTKHPANDHFIYYAAVGDVDFNYPELALLRRKKDEQGAPFKIKVYPGP